MLLDATKQVGKLYPPLDANRTTLPPGEVLFAYSEGEFGPSAPNLRAYWLWIGPRLQQKDTTILRLTQHARSARTAAGRKSHEDLQKLVSVAVRRGTGTVPQVEG
jgi:hypothetical protein